jgi:hypothetical protein
MMSGVGGETTANTMRDRFPSKAKLATKTTKANRRIFAFVDDAVESSANSADSEAVAIGRFSSFRQMSCL